MSDYTRGLILKIYNQQTRTLFDIIKEGTENGAFLNLELEQEVLGGLRYFSFGLPSSYNKPLVKGLLVRFILNNEYIDAGVITVVPEKDQNETVLTIEGEGYGYLCSKILVNESFTNKSFSEIYSVIATNYISQLPIAAEIHTVINIPGIDITFEDTPLSEVLETLVNIANYDYVNTKYRWYISTWFNFNFRVFDREIADTLLEGFDYQDPTIENDTTDLINSLLLYRAISAENDELEYISTVEDLVSIDRYGKKQSKLVYPYYIAQSTAEKIAQSVLQNNQTSLVTQQCNFYQVTKPFVFSTYKLVNKLKKQLFTVSDCGVLSDWGVLSNINCTFSIASDIVLTGLKSIKISFGSGGGSFTIRSIQLGLVLPIKLMANIYLARQYTSPTITDFKFRLWSKLGDFFDISVDDLYLLRNTWIRLNKTFDTITNTKYLRVESFQFLEWTQRTKVQSSDLEAYGYFGYSVAIDGDYCIVGAYGEDYGGSDAGAAYIFKRGGNNWVQQAKIQASDRASSDYFGYSVAIDGDYCIVGANGEDTGGSYAGAAYIFKRDDITWSQQAKIQASDKSANANFGYSVAIDGDYCIVGAYREESIGPYTGAAYIFKRDGITWSQQAKIQSNDLKTYDRFGYSVAIDGDYCVVGASGESTLGTDVGAAYIFKRDGINWYQQEKIQASDLGSSAQFGNSVSINGEYCIIGTRIYTGAAYIFKRDGITWSQQAKIQASDPGLYDHFGYSVAIDGDYCIVGAYGEDTGESNAGAAYIFKRDGITWSQQAKIQASDKSANANFGYSVAIDGDYCVVGASGDSSIEYEAGSAYVYGNINHIPEEQQKVVPDTLGSTMRFGRSVSSYEDSCVIGASGEDAAYIFNKDYVTWSQGQKLEADDKTAGDNFGLSVAMFGDYCIIGAPYEDTGETNSGAAYIFKNISGTWTQQQKIKASDVAPNFVFGYSVSIADGVCAVSGDGAAYIFNRSGEIWSQTQKIQSSDITPGDLFGHIVKIDSNGYCAVGATYVNTGGEKAGAVYMFKLTEGVWAQTQKIQASDKEANALFGYSVSMYNSTCIIGAPYTIESEKEGAAYFFTLEGDLWVQQQKIQANDKDPVDQFGVDCQIYDNYCVIGAPYKNDVRVGFYGTYMGAAYLIKNNGVVWGQVKKISADIPLDYARFGFAVSLFKHWGFIGAPFENSNKGAVYILNVETTESEPYLSVSEEGDAKTLKVTYPPYISDVDHIDIIFSTNYEGDLYLDFVGLVCKMHKVRNLLLEQINYRLTQTNKSVECSFGAKPINLIDEISNKVEDGDLALSVLAKR